MQHFDGVDHAERRSCELFAQPPHLEDRRQVRDEDAAGAQGAERVLHDAPWFREVEDDPVEVGLVDSLVRVAYRYVERDVVTEEACDVTYRALREVVADLVA